MIVPLNKGPAMPKKKPAKVRSRRCPTGHPARRGRDHDLRQSGSTEMPLMDALVDAPDFATCSVCRKRPPWPWPTVAR